MTHHEQDQMLPLAGTVVLDLSRMLPGAILARQLLDLGARVIKVEDPDGGDPMRQVPPLAGGVGIGFATLLRGAESVCLDLSRRDDAANLGRLARSADVLVESFRPGTLERWGLDGEALRRESPRLVWCALPAFGSAPEMRGQVAHDLNLAGLTGVVEVHGGSVPPLQLADVGAGLLATSAVLAALLRRERGGSGCRIEQPLLSGPLPFMSWRLAEATLGRERVLGVLLGGGCPCYRVYRCSDGEAITVGCIKPKFWLALVELAGAPELAGAAFALGAEGAAAAERLTAALAARPRSEWLALAAERGLPLGAVREVDQVMSGPEMTAAGLVDELTLPGGATMPSLGPFLPGLGRSPCLPAPRLGEHTEAVLAEVGSPRRRARPAP